jgi:hypothetical protein
MKPIRAIETEAKSMGIDRLEFAFRLERRFGVKLSHNRLSKMVMTNDPPDIRVGDLFDIIRDEIPRSGVLDLELDPDVLWPTFQREISNGLGVDIEAVTKHQGLIHELGAE